MAKSIKELFERGIIRLAMLPEKNEYLLSDATQRQIKNGDLNPTQVDGSTKFLDLSKLDKLDGVVVTLIKQDYPAVSPNMWNTLYERVGLNYRRIFSVAEIDQRVMEEFLEAVKHDPKCLGGGAGSGFKDKIVPVLKRFGKFHPLVEIIGAANVIHKEKDGALVGLNSDGEGFVEGLKYELGKHGETIAGKKIAIFGAGGTTAAIAFTLVPYNPQEIVIINRTVSKAEEIADRINGFYKLNVVRAVGEDSIGEEMKAIDAVVNASDKGAKESIELYSAFGKITSDAAGKPLKEYFVQDLTVALQNMLCVPRNAVIADVNLTDPKHPPMTLQYARAAGYTRLQDGLEMVARQAVLQFKQRHGDIVPEEKVREIMFSAAGLKHG